jgi:hypothetical protein
MSTKTAPFGNGFLAAAGPAHSRERSRALALILRRRTPAFPMTVS